MPADKSAPRIPHRPIWTGSISIGLVNVPVKLLTMVRDHSVSFRLLHRADGQPIQYQRVCTRDNQVVPWEDIVRGFEVRKDEYVVFENEELDAVKPDSDRKIRLDKFVYSLSIDPVFFNRSYLLVPDGNDEAYSLLLSSFRSMGRAGVGMITLRTKEYPAVVREYHEALILTTLHYADEIVNPPDLEEIQKLSEPPEKELGIAGKIIGDLTGEFDIADFQDTYRDRLKDLIQKKMEGKTVTVEKPAAEEARELMDALQETLARLQHQ
ncbi:DNA end-binding protein Ku [Methanolinea mesophila]|uniref:non-homologous end joining protein Ku n=1 Tax=Methanolinea mesophila TaxID=547055 RepID=UPI001AE92BB8|nr:Ku protein [Methanolinea mesophila]MBP1927976.1 DNA end-binding protein Ku [Methanolinea mesophila]